MSKQLVSTILNKDDNTDMIKKKYCHPFCIKSQLRRFLIYLENNPVVNNWLIKTVIGWSITDSINFKNVLEIPSTPKLVLFYK